MSRTIEAIQVWLASIGESLAEAVTAVSAQAEMQERLVEKMERIEDAVATLVGKVGQMHDSISALESRLGSYLSEQAKKDSSVARLRQDHLQLVSEVREIQKGASGGER